MTTRFTAPSFAPSKTRGLVQLKRYIGDITTEIDARLERHQPVRILELGCGHGVALMELTRLYGPRVALSGINKEPKHGNRESLKAIALELGLYSESEIGNVELPELHYFDACSPWPLPSDSFDIIYSQSAFLWFPDKIKPLEEIHRLLKADGIARLDINLKRGSLPPEYGQTLVIRDGTKKISCLDYLQGFDNCRMKFPPQSRAQHFWRWINKRFGRRILMPKKKPYLEMRKSNRLDFGLEWVSSLRLADINPDWGGYQSFYQIRKESF